MSPAWAALAFLFGFLLAGPFYEYLARRRYRCEICGSRTNDEGVGAREMLDLEEDGS